MVVPRFSLATDREASQGDTMKYDIPAPEAKRAAHAHELLLVNLILNHVFLFISTLSLSGPYPYLPLVVPLISISILSYILWRAHRAQTNVHWFVNAHWQMCARRSRIFLSMLVIVGLMLLLGWVGYAYFHLAKVLVLAWFSVAGLPVMGTLLTLVVLESDALNQARNGRFPQWAAQRFAASRKAISN